MPTVGAVPAGQQAHTGQPAGVCGCMCVGGGAGGEHMARGKRGSLAPADTSFPIAPKAAHCLRS